MPHPNDGELRAVGSTVLIAPTPDQSGDRVRNRIEQIEKSHRIHFPCFTQCAVATCIDVRATSLCFGSEPQIVVLPVLKQMYLYRFFKNSEPTCRIFRIFL